VRELRNLLSGAVARLSIFSASKPVKEGANPGNGRDQENDQETIHHHRSPASQYETVANANHIAAPERATSHDMGCGATNWLKTSAAAAPALFRS
jgi:hypothetical protein